MQVLGLFITVENLEDLKDEFIAEMYRCQTIEEASWFEAKIEVCDDFIKVIRECEDD